MYRPLIVAAFTVALSAHAHTQEPGLPLYPAKLGSKWYYRVMPPKGEIYEVITEVTKSEFKQGRWFVTLKHTGPTTSTDELVIAVDGVYLVGSNGMPFPKPIQILRVGAKPNESWTIKTGERLDEVEMIGTYTATETTVFPAGTFKTHKVKLEVKPARGGSQIIHYWYAEGVGPVAQIYYDVKTDKSTRFELMKYEPGR